MSMCQERSNGCIQLERTGPSIDPITFPGEDIVVTDAFRMALEQSGLTGFSFLPVIKHRIIELDWTKWDLLADEPPEDPEVWEPEDYLLERPHSTEACDALGNLWELVLQQGIKLAPEQVYWKVSVLKETWDGTDIFKAAGYNCVSLRAHMWLTETVGELVKFLPLK